MGYCSRYNRQVQYGNLYWILVLKNSYKRHFNDNWEYLNMSWILNDITELYF